MYKILFISVVCMAMADEIKQDPGARTSRAILHETSGSDGGYGATLYGKSDGLHSYSSDLTSYGPGGGHDFSNGLSLGLEGSYPGHSFSSISGHDFGGNSFGSVGGHSTGGLNFGEHHIGGHGNGGLTLGGGNTGHNFDLGGASSISSLSIAGQHYNTNYEGVEGEGLEGGDEGGHDGSTLPIYAHGVPNVHETTKAIPVHKTIQIPIHHPVHQAIKVPVPINVPVPYAIKIPIPVQVEKTVNVPVEKVIHYPVEKPIPFKVVKKVPFPVSKPYPVPYPVYKVRYVYHTRKIHHGHHHHHGHHY